MPSSSRLPELFGVSSPLRRNRGLLPDDSGVDGWPAILANGLGGGHLAAEADPTYARVRVDLYWPRIRWATVERVHPDGSTYEVRGGDPARMCTAWARWDYECPPDVEVYYRATSDRRDGLVAESGPVTLDSQTEAWLKHPAKPWLNRMITIRSWNTRQRQARRGVLTPPLRKFPIVVHGARGAESGQLVLQTADTDELDAINEVLDDGADLMLQLPASWGGQSWYVAVSSAGFDRLEPMLPTLHIEHVGIAFDRVDRPEGAADGGHDHMYELLPETYDTYNQVRAAHSTYLDLSMSP